LTRCRAFLSKRGLSLGGVSVALLTLLLGGFVLYVFVSGKCDMTSKFMPLLATSAKHLNSVTGTSGYWLDYGTLLGAIRGQGIIPYEFDLDMGVLEDDCPKYQALKEPLAKDGLRMYNRGEWVPGKENKLLGYDGYLHKACARIYSSDHSVFIDFDWSRRLTYAEAHAEAQRMAAEGATFDMPVGYTEAQGDILCNYEAWEKGSSGGCRLASHIFPLQPLPIGGIPLMGVAQPEALLEEMYGPDWRIPRAKGYKALLCGWMPLNTLAFTLVWLMLVATPLALFKLLPPAWVRAKAFLTRRSVFSDKPDYRKYAAVPISRSP